MSGARRRTRRAKSAEEEAFRSSIESATRGTATAAVAESLVGTLDRFQRGRAFVLDARIREFARELDVWLDEVEAAFVACYPDTAWKLVDRFIRADHAILARAEDSNGSIGDCFARACTLWLRTAGALPADLRWVERIHALYAECGRGTRDAILNEAAVLLSGLELRRLARIYADEVVEALRHGDLHRAMFAATALDQVDKVIGGPPR